MRFYIKVPYSEKDEAKRLGAKWDPVKKSWYYLDRDHVKFKKWETMPRNKAEKNHIVNADKQEVNSRQKKDCFKCMNNKATSVSLVTIGYCGDRKSTGFRPICDSCLKQEKKWRPLEFVFDLLRCFR